MWPFTIKFRFEFNKPRIGMVLGSNLLSSDKYFWLEASVAKLNRFIYFNRLVIKILRGCDYNTMWPPFELISLEELSEWLPLSHHWCASTKPAHHRSLSAEMCFSLLQTSIRTSEMSFLSFWNSIFLNIWKLVQNWIQGILQSLWHLGLRHLIEAGELCS